MTREGPSLERLMRRLSETPADFQGKPTDNLGRGDVVTGAVVSDLLCWLGGYPLSMAYADMVFTYTRADDAVTINHLRAVLVASWLLFDEWFASDVKGLAIKGSTKGYADSALEFLRVGLLPHSALTNASSYINDPEGREELSRLVLRALDLRPAGETPEQSADRLSTISAVERDRVIRESRAAEERAREVREAMAQKAAEEAAASYGRE